MKDIEIYVKGIFENIDLNVKGLNVLTGLNGTGKSLCNKLIWLMENLYFVLANKAIKETDYHIITDMLQKTFTRCDFTGSVIANFDTNNLTIEFEGGNITNCFLLGPLIEDPTAIPASIYLSTNTRLLSSWEQYFTVKKIVNPEQLPEMFPLYDYHFLELMHLKLLSGGIDFTSKKETLESFKGFPYSTPVEINLKEDGLYISSEDQSVKHISNFSSGQQSILCQLAAQP